MFKCNWIFVFLWCGFILRILWCMWIGCYNIFLLINLLFIIREEEYDFYIYSEGVKEISCLFGSGLINCVRLKLLR